MILDRIEYQKAMEHRYSRKNIRQKVIDEVFSDTTYIDMLEHGVELLNDFLSNDYYESKQVRLAQFNRDTEQTVKDIFISLFLVHGDQDYTAVVGSIVKDLKMSSTIDGVKTSAEMLAVLCETNLFDIYKDHKYDSLKFKMNYELSPQLQKFIKETKYLPPTIVEPDEIKSNYDSDGLTTKGSMILGKGNHHDEELCLDSLNLFNQIPLTLNVDLLMSFSEQKPGEFTNEDHEQQWFRFVNQSYQIYKELIQAGNQFYLYHKNCKRGRTYSQGYHVNTQGNKFRKAIIEFAEQEVVTC